MKVENLERASHTLVGLLNIIREDHFAMRTLISKSKQNGFPIDSLELSDEDLVPTVVKIFWWAYEREQQKCH